jgi:hypothetical protein
MESCSVSRKYAFDGRIHGYSYIMSRQRSRPSTCFHELSTNDKSQAWLHDVMAQCSSIVGSLRKLAHVRESGGIH